MAPMIGADIPGRRQLAILNGHDFRQSGIPMRFFYLLAPATWLKIALVSLLLASASLWYLTLYRIRIDTVPMVSASKVASVAGSSKETSAPPAASAASALPAPPPALAPPPTTAQNQAIAPDGILDPYAEFAAFSDFDDSKVQSGFVLPDPVAPPLLLDPNWNGNPP